MHRRKAFRIAGMVVAAALVVGNLAGVAAADVTMTNGFVVSFDNVKIRYTLFTPASDVPVPVAFYSHGWGGSRATSADDATVKMFLDRGYAVLTWDARGFGESGGEANVDSQEFEVRDVRALIDLVAGVEGIALDAEGDPRMGMYGGSYAGGIQLETAAADSRVDAIAPQIAWNDLTQALKPNGVIKLGWDLVLVGGGAVGSATGGIAGQETGVYAGQLYQVTAESLALNDWTSGTYSWFDARSPKHYIEGATLVDGTVLPGINVPALVIQGTSDTLFNLNQGIANFRTIRDRVGADKTKMIWYCGGHTLAPLGSSCVPGSASDLIAGRVADWFDRWVKEDESVDTGPAFEYQLQDGTFASAQDLPSEEVGRVEAQTRVTHAIAPTSGQGTAGTPAGCRPKTEKDSTQSYARDCPAVTADWLPIGTMTGPEPKKCGDPPKPLCLPTFEYLKPGVRIVGAPRVSIRLTGTSPEAYVFFKLIDYDTVAKTSVVIDDQVTALKALWLNLSTPQIFDLDLAAVSWEVKEGHQQFLEIAPNSNDHAVSRVPGSVTVDVVASIPGIPAA
ncbi:MAG: CocE/NonD family hydrolase [Actinomycetota bacterium]